MRGSDPSRSLSARPLPANAWSLEARDVEGARFCAAAEGHGPRTWPLTYSVNFIKPAGPPVGLGCWRNVCTEHTVRTYKDHAFVLHFDPLPVTLHVGDAVSFYVDATSGHAVLFSASDGPDNPPYFALGVL